MKLSEKERDIIHSAQLKADVAVAQLRELTGYRDHTIRYYMQRNYDSGAIERRCFVNLCLLGYTQYEIFFSLSSEGERCREALLSALISADQISWIGELGGDFQYGFNFCARGTNELTDFMDDLSRSFGEIFAEKEVAIRVALSFFGNKYLSHKPRAISSLGYEVTDQRVEIDDLDHRILSGAINRSGDSRRALAQELGVPLSTVDYRLKKLEQAGVIVGYYLKLDPAQVGMQSFLLLIGVKSVSKDLRAEFFQFCDQHPNVVVQIHCVGSWDFEIAVEVQDARKVGQITQALNDSFGSRLRFIKVLPSFSYPKVKEYPFQVANS